MTAVEALGRAIGLYRRSAVTRSTLALLVANAIPVLGVLFFGWSLITILILYWLENGIVGLWNVPKIVLARGALLPRLPELAGAVARAARATPEEAASIRWTWRTARRLQHLALIPRMAMSIFFLLHYGIFWLVHGVFVFALPAFGSFGAEVPCPEGLEPCAESAFGEIAWGAVLLGAVALVLSHGASFAFNYLGRGEYRTASPARQMMLPYARVVVLHLTIIFGAFVVALLGAPIGALLVLVGLKTVLDVRLHRREHYSTRP